MTRLRTFRQAKRDLSFLGITLLHSYGTEFKVNFRGGPESTAYYTSDIEDAYNTAILMAKAQTERLASKGELN